MNAQIELIEGTNRDLELSQYFTPPELAQRVVEWAGLVWAGGMPRHMRVLEPSAGNGALVRPLVAAGAEVTAVEIDARYCDELDLANPRHIVNEDFLSVEPSKWFFDLCVMNPPYENGLDVQFILHALKFAPRVVGIFTDRIMFGVERKEGLWSKVRPTRIAYQSRRPWKGAQTDYVVLELVRIAALDKPNRVTQCTLEWW